MPSRKCGGFLLHALIIKIFHTVISLNQKAIITFPPKLYIRSQILNMALKDVLVKEVVIAASFAGKQLDCRCTRFLRRISQTKTIASLYAKNA